MRKISKLLLFGELAEQLQRFSNQISFLHKQNLLQKVFYYVAASLNLLYQKVQLCLVKIKMESGCIHMKKKLSLLLVPAIALTLTACGSSGGQASTTPSPSPSIPIVSPTFTKVENMEITLTWDTWDAAGSEIITVTRDGLYTGDVVDGIPNGQGAFSAVNDEGTSWVYTGAFKNGKFSGYGKTVWDEINKIEEGTYADGLFTPNTFELFNSLKWSSFIEYDFSKENIAFINENIDIFPATTDKSRELMLSSIYSDLTYSMMVKTLDGLEGQLYECMSSTALQVFQESLYGHTITSIIAYDDASNFYVILYDGALPDIYADMKISFVGLPISASGFENVSGGTTNAIVLLGSMVSTIA